jgi:hypothetical protein
MHAYVCLKLTYNDQIVRNNVLFYEMEKVPPVPKHHAIEMYWESRGRTSHTAKPSIILELVSDLQSKYAVLDVHLMGVG